MSTIIFHNPGQLDIRGATTMGLSAKQDASAIGKFGTGLKYAIASVLRWGGAIEIETAGRKYEFRTRNIDFRGKAHQQIEMVTHDPEVEGVKITELGYTTHYGSHWEGWQVFRELESNCRDEGGKSFVEGKDPFWNLSDETVIRVTCQQITDAYLEKDTILLPSKGTRHGGSHDLHYIGCPSNFLYYRGVRVKDAKCIMTWNLMKGVELTEDRSVKSAWTFDCAAAEFIQQSTDREFISKCIRKGDKFENAVNYNDWYDTSEVFLDVAEGIWKKSGAAALAPGVMAILKNKRQHIDAPKEVKLTKLQQSMLTKAIGWVERMGHKVDMPVKVVDFDKSTLGMSKNGEVFLSPEVFRQGTKQVVSTLLEEVIHHETGLLDGYELQTYLFNRLVGMYEEQFGEAI